MAKRGPKINGKFHNARVHIESEDRRRRISELYLAGKTQCDIALEIGINQQSVSAHLKKVREGWRSSALRNFDEAKSLELARVDQLEMEAWMAWERSIGTHLVSTSKTGPNGTETTEKSEILVGDPRFLDAVQRCIEARRKILGLDAPARTSLENPDGSSLLSKLEVVYVNRPAELSDSKD